jgi:hypothetical protein
MFFVLAVRADTLLSIAEFMDKELDVWQAIKFDGGGSSQVYYGGAGEPLVEDGDGRLLTNFLAIYAQPGSGISVEAPPELPPDSPGPPPGEGDLTWWQEIQKGWTDFWDGAWNWWQERQTSFNEWLEGVETWWQNLPSNIAEWLWQQFLKWVSETINQLCGSAGLIPVALALVVYSKKRNGNR